MSATQEIDVSLTLQEWQVVYAGLGELPLKLAQAVAAKVQTQVGAAAQRQQPMNGEAVERPQ